MSKEEMLVEKKLVKIMSCSNPYLWYNNKIGEVFEVRSIKFSYYQIYKANGSNSFLGVRKKDGLLMPFNPSHIFVDINVSKNS